MRSAHRKPQVHLSGLLARYEDVTDNPIVNVVDPVVNYWRSWLLLILQTGTYRYATIMRLLNNFPPGAGMDPAPRGSPGR